MKLKLISILSLCLLFVSAVTGCSPASDFNSQLSKITKPYQFSMFNWEVGAITGTIKQSISGPDVTVNDTQTVLDYFADIRNNRQPSAVRTDETEKIIELQIRSVLNQEGITNPFAGRLSFLKFHFPPVDFTLSKPPFILVISPRDKIQETKSVMLEQNLTTKQMEAIETAADKLGVSALVVEIGGLGVTFPTFVNYETSLHYAINAATEEWLHQYLAFTPLGSRYVLDLLGISTNYDIVTMNETVASMTADEIGGMVYDKYYAAIDPENQPTNSNGSGSAPAFDFNAAMRQIRVNVDTMLAAGQIDQAEAYMNQQRDYLQTQGYDIRKLNQAYFAFNGSYAEGPTSVNPIGAQIVGIRAAAPSLAKFLNEISRVTSTSGLNYLPGNQ